MEKVESQVVEKKSEPEVGNKPEPQVEEKE